MLGSVIQLLVTGRVDSALPADYHARGLISKVHVCVRNEFMSYCVRRPKRGG